MKHSAKPLQKLRNRFFALILSMFLVVLTGAFAVAYLNTYNNIQREITARLDANWNFHALSDPLLMRINLSETGEVTSIDSLLDMPPYILEQMVAAALDNFTPGYFSQDYRLDQEYGLLYIVVETALESTIPDVVTVGDREWRFVSSADSVFTVMDNAGENVSGLEVGQRLTFLDVTEFNNTLSSLVYTLLVIALFLFPITAAISFYFSNRAVNPIALAWEKQTQFIADASHELKTPLTIMKSNLGIVLSNPGETVDTQMEWLGYVEAGANRMSQLASDLLSLANADNSDLEKEHVNVSGALIALLDEMAAKADEKGAEITTFIQPNVAVNSDLEKLRQIITILLDNAIKYTEPNGTVLVSLTQTNGRLSLSVTNSGQGIKETELPNIFDRFYQTEPSRNSRNGGFGLGLSIAKALTDKLCGNLSVTSAENENTTFTFVL